MKGKKCKKMIPTLVIVFILLAVLIIWTVWANKALMLNTITVKNEKLPESFDGYLIAHISDLHNCEIGKNNQKLIETVRSSAPDLIVITGDLLDSRRLGYENNLSFLKSAVKIAPCYFVPGNHEAKSTQYLELKGKMILIGVNVLEDKKAVLERNGEKINLLGICDPVFKTQNFNGDTQTITDRRLKSFFIDNSSFNILLAHRPELFETYVDYGLDLVLSGHAHGGQFRLPFIGGLIAPNQGLFPKYDSGLYTKNNTNMIVSRGIGKSIIPFRFNNRPEVILVELKNS